MGKYFLVSYAEIASKICLGHVVLFGETVKYLP